jgi:hypothetical protein
MPKIDPAPKSSVSREHDVGKNRDDRFCADVAIDDGDVGRLSAMWRGGPDQIDRASSGVRKGRSHIRVPGMRIAPHLHHGIELIEKRQHERRRTSEDLRILRRARPLLGTPSQVLVALSQIEHQSF